MQIDTFSRMSLFSNLNDEQLQCIAGLGSEIAIDRGTQIAKQGDPALSPPAYHIWTQSQIPWFDLLDELPRYKDSGPDR